MGGYVGNLFDLATGQRNLLGAGTNRDPTGLGGRAASQTTGDAEAAAVRRAQGLVVAGNEQSRQEVAGGNAWLEVADHKSVGLASGLSSSLPGADRANHQSGEQQTDACAGRVAGVQTTGVERFGRMHPADDESAGGHEDGVTDFAPRWRVICVGQVVACRW